MFNNFQEYAIIHDFLDKYGSFSVAENSYDWVKNYVLPNYDLGLPTVEKKGKIILLIQKRNPIYVQLDDGTKLFFTYDEFKRINGEPVVGKTMAVKLLRLSHDNTDSPSKIHSCRII